jgi:hypothetical protein
VLDVPLPEGNLDFQKLALAACQGLHRDAGGATREALGQVVKFKHYTAAGSRVGGDTRGGITAAYWKVRLSDAWTVPVTVLTRGLPKGNTLLLADTGRKAADAEIEALLAAGQRVITVDPLILGESSMAGRTYLYALLLAAVGDRALGIQAGQVAAVSHWASVQFKGMPAVRTLGPRSSLMALVAKAMEARNMGALRPVDEITSLESLIRDNASVMEKPECFCFGLLAAFDVPEIKALADD